MRNLTVRLLAAFLLVLTLPTGASAATDPSPGTVDTGPALVSLRGDGGRPAITTTPESGLRVDAGAARIVVPDDLPDAWAFLGEGGETRYQLPGAGAPGLPSFALTADTGSEAGQAALTVRVAGPGDVTAFTGGAGKDPVNRIVDTAARDTSTVELAAGAPLRPTWIFTEPGTYTFEITPTIGNVTGAPAIYTVDLVALQPSAPVPTTPAPTPTGTPAPVVDINGAATSYLSGQAAELRAEPKAKTNLDTYQWQVRRAGDSGYRTVTGNASDLYGFVAAPNDDGARVRVRLLDAAGATVSTSKPANIVVAGQVRDRTATASKTELCFAAEVPDDAITVDDGHFDFGVQVADGKLISRVKDDRAEPPVWRQPASTLFRVDDTAAVQVPESPTFSFLGEPGATVWGIGQTQEDGIPWLGWNTQHASAISAIDGGTTWTLDSVDGPGDLFVYQTGSFGALTKVFGTPDDWPRTTTIPANTHAHGNWSFTKPGIYRVATTHTAKLKAGGTVTSQETLTFLVGPCASAPDKPTANVPDESLLADDDLVAGNQGGIKVSPTTVEAGDTVTITLPDATEGAWFMPVFYSTPQQTAWKAATAESTLSAVTVPDLKAGSHKVAVHDATGALVGWAPLTVKTAPDDTKPDDTKPDDTKPDERKPDESGATGGGAVPGAGGGGAAAQVCVPSTGAAGGGDAGGGGGSEGGASTVSTGHFDFGAHIVSDRLVPRVKDDRTQPPKWVDPATRTFALGAKAQQKVPAGNAYSFLGAAGSTVWLIPQTQVDGVPWLGWNTQHESMRAQVKGSVNFRLDSVSGPGKLGVYLTDSFGGVGDKKFGNMSGFPQSFNVPLNVHAHGNWAFSAPGTYKVTMTQTVTLTSGKKASAPAVLTFTVGGGSASQSSARTGTEGMVRNAILAAATPSATPTPAEESAAADTDAGDATKTGESSCILPAAGAPDILWMVGVGLLLMASGVVVITVTRTSARRTTA